MGRESRATKVRYLKGGDPKNPKFINGSAQEMKDDISISRRLEKLGLTQPEQKVVIVS